MSPPPLSWSPLPLLSMILRRMLDLGHLLFTTPRRRRPRLPPIAFHLTALCRRNGSGGGNWLEVKSTFRPDPHTNTDRGSAWVFAWRCHVSPLRQALQSFRRERHATLSLPSLYLHEKVEQPPSPPNYA